MAHIADRRAVGGVGKRSGGTGGEVRRRDERRALLGLVAREVCGEVSGDGVVMVRGGQLNCPGQRRGSDGGRGWLVKALSEPVNLRLQLLTKRANLGQEQLVVETHGAQLRFGIGMAPSTNLFALPFSFTSQNSLI
jgi:hypothetical protein